VLHDVIFTFMIWVGDEVFKITWRHAELVPT
jgi:hypothetical protein